MSFWKFWQRRNGKGSIDKALLGFDLFSHLSYMSAIATSGVSRGVVFEEAAKLPYTSSRYFGDVHILSTRLNYDYAEACRLKGEVTREEDVKSLLLRLSSSLAAGEEEHNFLTREAQTQAETYGNEYERQIESTKKWTDSYVALIVSAALIIIIAVVSMMLYQVGLVFLFGLAGTTVAVTVAGSWIIWKSVPKETKTHSLPERSREQRLARRALKILLPLGLIVGALSFLMGLGLGWAMILVAVLVLPVGLVMSRDDKKINKRDSDIASFLRALGAVTKTTGTTVTEALGRIDIRSTGSLAPDVKRLHVRLTSGIEPDLCWRRFVAETGSELIDRTVRIFWDGINKGGDPDEVGARASFFATKIAQLRAKRQMVSSTFGWLSMPMHAALVVLLVFIVNVMELFGQAIQSIQPASGSDSEIPLSVGTFGSVGSADLAILNHLVMLVIVVLTASNGFAVHAAAGGHGYKLFYHVGLMMIIAGGALLIVPRLADGIFGSIGTIGG